MCVCVCVSACMCVHVDIPLFHFNLSMPELRIFFSAFLSHLRAYGMYAHLLCTYSVRTGGETAVLLSESKTVTGAQVITVTVKITDSG